jgi:hypothetical protein
MFSLPSNRSTKLARNAWLIFIFILSIFSSLFGSATGVSASRLAEIGPTVTGVSSSSPNGVYELGMPISITVTFDVPVNVTGTPQLELETGGTDQVINYTAGSGTTTLTFSYVVQIGDYNLDLDYTNRFALTLNGGTIQDTSTSNPADLLLPVPGTPGSLSANKDIVIEDGNMPMVTNITSTAANGAYGLGALIPVTVIFSEAVKVTGTPQLTLETGATDQVVDYSSGNGTNTLTFNYTVQTGDTNPDLDYFDANALALNGGTIRDGNTTPNDAILALPMPGASGSLGANKDIIIAWDAATVTSVASTDGFYGLGALIPITVTFSEAVNVSGTPQLTLETGSTDRVATYSSGSGTATLTFNYTVQAGDESPDLDYLNTNALTLNGGSIQDLSATNAALTLPTPSAAGSLSANNNVVVDAVAPETAIETTPTNPTSSVNATFTFSGTDNISAEGTLTFECRFDGGSFSTCVTPKSYTGLAAGSHTFETRATDGLNNTDATQASFTWVIDTTAPNTIIDSTPANPSASSAANFTFHGVDAESGIAAAVCDLDGGGFTACDALTTQAYTGLVDGSHTFQVYTVNNASLTDATPASFTWTVDTIPPTVIINQASGQADPSSAISINFTATFSEPVTGFNSAADVTLSGTAGATTVQITGGPTVYNVAVSGMTTSGTVTVGIPASAATDLVGHPNAASTSTDGTVNYVHANLILNQSYRIKYDTWLGLEDLNALGTSNNGYRKATSGTFTFKPNQNFTSFKWVTYRGPNQGKAGVLVDGVIKATVDLYRATAQWQYEVTISGLSNAKHTVVIKPLGIKNPASSNKWVVVDGFKIGSVVYNDDKINVPYDDLFSYGSWRGKVATGPLSGAYRISNVRNATASLSFVGTQFNLITARGPSYGKVAIYADGVLKQTVDLYRATQQWQYKVAISGLTSGYHNVAIKVLGVKNPASTGTDVVCDGFEIK